MKHAKINSKNLSRTVVKERIDLSVLKMFPGTEVPRNIQNEILNYFRSESYENNAKDPKNNSYDVWNALSIRAIDPTSFPEKYRQQRISQVEYLFRHDPRTRWNWNNEVPLTPLIQNLVRPYEQLFSFFSRVKVHIQKIGGNVPFHRDLTAGNFYQIPDPCSTALAVSGNIAYQMYPWVDLNDLPSAIQSNDPVDKNAFSLKIPLSEDPLNYGKQTIYDGGEFYYTTQGNAYLLNENCFHGSEAVSFMRGLVFIDGIINPEGLNQLKVEPVSARPMI